MWPYGSIRESHEWWMLQQRSSLWKLPLNKRHSSVVGQPTMCLFHKEFDEIDPVSKWSIMFSLQLELAMRNEKMNPRERARMQLLEKISPVSQLGTVNDQMKIMKNEFKTIWTVGTSTWSLFAIISFKSISLLNFCCTKVKFYPFYWEVL